MSCSGTSFPTHPGTASTNRRPTRIEVDAALPFLEELTRGRHAVAVGRVAHAVLGGHYVRHPSHGGARAFRAGLVESLREAATAFRSAATRSLLAAGLAASGGMMQVAVAVGTTTLVLVTGVESIVGLGPAIFLSTAALAALPAGRAMDRYGRMPVIAGGFATGIVATRDRGARLSLGLDAARRGRSRPRRCLCRHRDPLARGRGGHVPIRAACARHLARALRRGRRGRSRTARLPAALRRRAPRRYRLARGAVARRGGDHGRWPRHCPLRSSRSQADRRGAWLRRWKARPPTLMRRRSGEILRRPGRDHRARRGGRELRRDGVRHEPLRLHRRRPRAQPSRHVLGDQRPHRRHVRPRARGRRRDRPHRTAARPHRRPPGDGRSRPSHDLDHERRSR